MRGLILLLATLATLIGACGSDFREDASPDVAEYRPPADAGPSRSGSLWEVTVDWGVSEAELDAFSQASMTWEIALADKCPMQFEIRRGTVGAEVPKEVRQITFTTVSTLEGGLLGWTEWWPRNNSSSARILALHLRPDTPWDYQEVLEHEIGHALNLYHGGKGIMGSGVDINAQDASNVASYHCAPTSDF